MQLEVSKSSAALSRDVISGRPPLSSHLKDDYSGEDRWKVDKRNFEVKCEKWAIHEAHCERPERDK